MTFPSVIPEKLSYLRSTFNTNMVIVIGTLAIFFAGIFFTLIKNKLNSKT
jgi:SSS family solute:Na+ symporter